ncbi:MAG: glycosyltransferase family 4 protein [Bacteroidaceae bacterium]|nr:glycosyltransferase family 4 protein [Bacteroidaceae bacterium]
MKILYCIAGTRHSGGMERVLANKANWLVRHGYEVAIATTDQEGEKPFFPLDERIECYDLGIGYEKNNGKSFINKLLHYPIKQYRHRKRLAALLQQVKPDITISMFCNDVSFLPHLKDGSKKILEIHFSKFKRLQYGRKGMWRIADIYRNRQEEKLVQRFDRFVVLTEEDKGYWGDLHNIEVIPNARTFNPTTIATLNTKRVVAIGRYTHQKGFERLIEAWNKICRQHPDWKLEIVGEGEERQTLQTLINSYGIAHSITLCPLTNDMDTVYRGASIIAMSSRYEGLPMILLEAQAYGLPIVSFNCQCGPADIITDGMDGYLIPEGDCNTLASKLETLVKDTPLRQQMGKVARKNSERYAEEVIMAKWTTLFDKLNRQQ